jgi:large subunit ribosomal protein L35
MKAHAIYFYKRGEIFMPKIKTNRAAAKRFRKTGTGKIVYKKSNASHILTKKTTKRKRSLRKSRIVDKTNAKAIRLMLPNG